MSLGISSDQAVFEISPQNYVVCLLHWKILSKLFVILDQDARDTLKSTMRQPHSLICIVIWIKSSEIQVLNLLLIT